MPQHRFGLVRVPTLHFELLQSCERIRIEKKAGKETEEQRALREEAERVRREREERRREEELNRAAIRQQAQLKIAEHKTITFLQEQEKLEKELEETQKELAEFKRKRQGAGSASDADVTRLAKTQESELVGWWGTMRTGSRVGDGLGRESEETRMRRDKGKESGKCGGSAAGAPCGGSGISSSAAPSTFSVAPSSSAATTISRTPSSSVTPSAIARAPSASVHPEISRALSTIRAAISALSRAPTSMAPSVHSSTDAPSRSRAPSSNTPSSSVAPLASAAGAPIMNTSHSGGNGVSPPVSSVGRTISSAAPFGSSGRSMIIQAEHRKLGRELAQAAVAQVAKKRQSESAERGGAPWNSGATSCSSSITPGERSGNPTGNIASTTGALAENSVTLATSSGAPSGNSVSSSTNSGAPSGGIRFDMARIDAVSEARAPVRASVIEIVPETCPLHGVKT